MVRPCVAREFCRYGGSGLASMYPAFDWSVSLLAIMGISAGAISLAERPDRAIWVTSVRTRREDRTSISSRPLADLGRLRCIDLTTSSRAPHFARVPVVEIRQIGLLPHRFCAPRMPGHELERSRRY